MTYVRITNKINSTNSWGRVKVGNRYVWIEYSVNLGPIFWWNSAMVNEYMPTGEDDPIWPEFEKWLAKYNLQKVKK